MTDIVERLRHPAHEFPLGVMHEATVAKDMADAADTIEALRREVKQSNEQVSFWRGAAFDRDMAITRAKEAEQRADALAARVEELEGLVSFWTQAAHDRDRLAARVKELER